MTTPAISTPQAFVAKWQQATVKERSGYQEHFLDLCNLLAHPTPVEADPEGTWFTFEAGATKHTGGQGWADVWKRGYFAWEYKGQHADLDKAYDQLLRYHDALDNPPILIVSDMQTIRIHTKFTNTVKQVFTLSLDDLLDPKKLQILHHAFHDPESLRARQTPEQVTQAAAAEFARLAEDLRKYGDAPSNEAIAHFLIRLLFCLFAEDVGLLPTGIFSTLIERTKGKSKDFQMLLQQLFAAMSAGGWFGYDPILHFDGRLFDDAVALELDGNAMRTLARISRLDWSSVEPAIFGTLFERSLDPTKRSQLGAHYTSKEDILLIVEPVLMAPLRRRWAEVQAAVAGLVSKRDAAANKAAGARFQKQLQEQIQGFQAELAQVQVLDPACGSGNFLYMALRELLDLWKETNALAFAQGLPQLPLEHTAPSPEQLHGIEINAYAHELAQVTIWIGYIQWMRDNGYGFPSEPILKPLDAIQHMDAILARDTEGKPVEPEWPPADVIIGNPPFLGGNKIRKELGDKVVEDLFALYAGRVPAFADLVCYWFEKSRVQIEAGITRRAGLLATNSIRGGANRKVLERIKETGDIFWAISDRDWILDGAAVNVSMVGFDNGSEHPRTLDGQPVENINPDLTAAVNLTVAQSLSENAHLCFRSDEKGGPFDIDAETAAAMLAAPLNPNGRPNSDVVRPYFNAYDILRGSRKMWIIDFGCETSLEEAALYELPFEHVQQIVKPAREQVKIEKHREYWWLHRIPACDMRKAIMQLGRFIATPRVSKHRIFVWLNNGVIPDCQLYVFARADDYFFGVLHSTLHELWALRQGTSLEDRPRYTPTTTFETFPFPWAPGTEPAEDADARVAAIAEAARDLVAKRDAWLNPPGASEAELKKRTLTNLYNQRPTWLAQAHARLDRAVFEAYGWGDGLSDEEILERLLALNLKRAGE
jgi:type II restriction/modification system DNA methylase subunit YeeA